MTSLNTISKRIKRILDGSDFKRQSPLDVREIADTVRDVTHYLMKGRWYELKAEGESNLPSAYVATYECEVKTITRRGKTVCYIDLPATPLELPMEMGVQQIIPLGADDEREEGAMIPIPRYFKSIYGGLRAGLLEHQFGYEVERGKVYFTEKDGDNVKAFGIDKVEADLAVMSPQDIGMDDPYPAPPEMIEDIVKLTLERYGISPQLAQQATMQKTPNLAD